MLQNQEFMRIIVLYTSIIKDLETGAQVQYYARSYMEDDTDKTYKIPVYKIANAYFIGFILLFKNLDYLIIKETNICNNGTPEIFVFTFGIELSYYVYFINIT
jgi:hypothetical protein